MTSSLTVVLSTLNGSERLPDVLDDLICAETPDAGFEVIVVDNASTDNTSDILQSYSDKLPLTALYEPRAGKNIALNRALAVSTGDLIIFTDDDVRIPTDFLRRYRDVADKEDSYQIFGGHIAPRWSQAPDPRILQEVPLNTAYALTESDRRQGDISANRLYGPNMAIRRSVFESGLTFDEAIGPNGGRYIMGDETDLLLRAEAAGFKAYFVPQIVVEHKIRIEQIEIDWIARRANLAGRSMVHNQIRKYHGRLPVAKKVWGMPRWAVHKLLVSEGQLIVHRVLRFSSGLFSATWESSFFRGYCSEYRRCINEYGEQ